MKRLFRRTIKLIGIGLVLLGLFIALAIPISPSRFYQFHAFEAIQTVPGGYDSARSRLVRIGVLHGYAGGFCRKGVIRKGGGTPRVLTDGWFGGDIPSTPSGGETPMPVDMTTNGTGNRINLTIAGFKLLGNHDVTYSLLLPLWLWSLLFLIPGLTLGYLTRRRHLKDKGS
ncbi:MAG: hypothetical protein AAF085_05830 [Planctomycetota bacterium]